MCYCNSFLIHNFEVIKNFFTNNRLIVEEGDSNSDIVLHKSVINLHLINFSFKMAAGHIATNSLLWCLLIVKASK